MSRTFLLCAMLMANVAFASDVKDASRVAAVLARILGYEKTLSSRANGRVDVTVVFKKGDSASEGEAAGFEAALAALGTTEVAGLPLRWSKVEGTSASLKEAVGAGTDVFVLCRGTEAELAAATALGTDKGILTVGLSRSFAEKGAAVALDRVGESIKIIINGESLKAAKVQFATQLLRVAEVL